MSMSDSSGGDFSDEENHDDLVNNDGVPLETEAFLEEASKRSTRVTKEDVLKGQDPQGIPWSTLDTTRAEYRESRLHNYMNYENLTEHQVQSSRQALEEEINAHPVSQDAEMFAFENNERLLRSSIVHFQLRNLVWATSSHDVFVTHVNEIVHYSYHTERTTPVLSLEGLQVSLGRVQISTMAVEESVCIAGSFYGDIVCVRVPHHLSAVDGRRECRGELVYCDRITSDDNAITNAIVVWKPRNNSSLQAVISNNDMNVRIMDIERGFTETNKFTMPWSVNYTAISPDGKLACVVGDATEAVLLDMTTGQRVGECNKHLDYSFAAAWHPGGNLLTTGNQDKTSRVWDIRTMKCLATLPGKIGAIRSLRFTNDGKYLAVAEPADFVRLYDVADNMHSCQEIDMFGEVSGISFSPDGDALFIGIADRIYGSMMQFRRCRKGLLSSSLNDYDFYP
jgi:WD40 repeat protein